MEKEDIARLLNEIKDKKEKKENIKDVFELFYNKYYSLVFKVAFSVLKNSENSEDVAQDVFTKIYKLAPDKFPERNEISWLYTVIKNEAISYLRKQKDTENIDDFFKISEENEEIENIINKDKYNRIINNLNTKQKEIVSLKILSDLSFKEISKLLNIPIGTVQWHYYKAINKLKKLLEAVSMCMVIIIVITMLGNNMNLRRNVSIANITSEEQESQNLYNEEESKQETALDSSPKKDKVSNEYDSIISVEQNIYENKTDLSTEKNSFEIERIIIITVLVVSILLIILIYEIIKKHKENKL